MQMYLIPIYRCSVGMSVKSRHSSLSMWHLTVYLHKVTHTLITMGKVAILNGRIFFCCSHGNISISSTYAETNTDTVTVEKAFHWQHSSHSILTANRFCIVFLCCVSKAGCVSTCAGQKDYSATVNSRRPFDAPADLSVGHSRYLFRRAANWCALTKSHGSWSLSPCTSPLSVFLPLSSGHPQFAFQLPYSWNSAADSGPSGTHIAVSTTGQ